MLYLKLLFAIVLVCSIHRSATSQNCVDLNGKTVADVYENIHVEALDNDSLASTYLIHVKDKVREHYHERHTEVVYILEGSGLMTLNDKEFEIEAGDYVFIPMGTRHSVTVKSEIPIKAMSIQTPHFDGSDRVFVSQK